MGGSLNKGVGVVFGAVYLVIGVLGFFVTGDTGFASSDGGLLLGAFEVNPLHNVVHLLLGGVLLGTGLAKPVTAQTTNAVIGGVYLFLTIYGIIVVNTAADVLAFNTMDHILHAASALLLLTVGIIGDGARQRRTAAA